MAGIRDHESIVQDLKKENFDLKLRLYAQSENSENTEDKVHEYEQQLAGVLSRFEQQQKIYEQQAQDLADAKRREKLLMKRQRNLENECKLKEERIQNLNVSLNQLSTSMTNLSSARHYTPARNTRSMYFPQSDDEDGIRQDDNLTDNTTTTTATTPGAVVPEAGTDTQSMYDDSGFLLQGRRSFESTSSDPTSRLTKNYYSTTVHHNYPNRGGDGYDNVGVVKPNNSRTGVDDVDVTEPPGQELVGEEKKKKKKGLKNLFGLCSGKSGDQKARSSSIYEKRPKDPPRVTVTTEEASDQRYVPSR